MPQSGVDLDGRSGRGSVVSSSSLISVACSILTFELFKIFRMPSSLTVSCGGLAAFGHGAVACAPPAAPALLRLAAPWEATRRAERRRDDLGRGCCSADASRPAGAIETVLALATGW